MRVLTFAQWTYDECTVHVHVHLRAGRRETSHHEVTPCRTRRRQTLCTCDDSCLRGASGRHDWPAKRCTMLQVCKVRPMAVNADLLAAPRFTSCLAVHICSWNPSVGRHCDYTRSHRDSLLAHAVHGCTDSFGSVQAQPVACGQWQH